MKELFNEQADTRMLIQDHLKQKGIKVSWLAEEILVSNSHLAKVLKQERGLSKENLEKINKALQTDFKLCTVTVDQNGISHTEQS